ncbi:MAG TPA: galactokinase [Firmicutes bacterium]|nr:galactokinase [Bacillota bacterium]
MDQVVNDINAINEVEKQLLKDRLSRLVAGFQARLGPRSPGELFAARAPGRVNLIGEHTDYNDGWVLPIAITRDVLMVGAARDDERVRLYAMDLADEVAFDLAENAFDDRHTWSNYIRGVIDVLQRRGFTLRGMDIAFTGNVPRGGGLSSSAALEVAAVMLLKALCGLEIPPLEDIKMAQQAENEFVGVRCGIMDQFISRLGRRHHALLIDCRTLEYRQIPWPADDVQLLVVDTKVERGLAGSAYNQRRLECETGARILAEKLPHVKALRDVTEEQFAAQAALLDEVVRRRCAHVVGENSRTLAAAKALAAGDYAKLGRLMIASHESLRDLYEVSCRELDAVVEIALATEGVYGARMTGGGFGGCAIALVAAGALSRLAANLRREYPKVAGHLPGLLPTIAGDGAAVRPLAAWQEEVMGQ